MVAACEHILFTAGRGVPGCRGRNVRQTSASATHNPLLASEAGARTPGEGRGIRTP